MSSLNIYRRALLASILFVSLLQTVGCAIKLAPSYDKTVVDGLTSVNEELMTFFASVSSGTNASDFDQRKPTYDRLVGKLGAIKIQSAARPVPRSQLDQIFGSARDVSVSPQELRRSEPPSVPAIDLMIKTMEKMRDTDQLQGVSAIEVSAFKGQIEISLDQALTYEKALER